MEVSKARVLIFPLLAGRRLGVSQKKVIRSLNWLRCYNADPIHLFHLVVAHGGLLPDELMLQVLTTKLDLLHDKVNLELQKLLRPTSQLLLPISTGS
jgi:hypothetical protein